MEKQDSLKIESIMAAVLRASLTGLLIGMMSSVANAAPYIGVGIGVADFTVDLSPLGGKSFDDTSTGTKIYGGYAFNRYIAAEATYYSFAQASVGAIETAPGSGNFVSATADMKGFGAYAVGMYPVTKRFNVMAKVGVLRWDADLGFNQQAASNSGTDAAYGVAASYGFTKAMLVTGEWESFDSENPEVSLISVGFKFIFR